MNNSTEVNIVVTAHCVVAFYFSVESFLIINIGMKKSGFKDIVG